MKLKSLSKENFNIIIKICTESELELLYLHRPTRFEVSTPEAQKKPQLRLCLPDCNKSIFKKQDI